MECPYCRGGEVTSYSGGFPYTDSCDVCKGKGELSESPIPYLASIASSLRVIAENLDAAVDKKNKYIWVRKAW